MVAPSPFEKDPVEPAPEGGRISPNALGSGEDDPFNFQPVLDPPLPKDSRPVDSPEQDASEGVAGDEEQEPSFDSGDQSLVVSSPLMESAAKDAALPLARHHQGSPLFRRFRPGGGGEAAGSATLMVALALVLLVFFIVLISLSHADRLRKDAVLESLKKTFSVMGVPLEVDSMAQPDAVPTPIKSFQQQVSELLSREIPSVRAKMLQSGDVVVAMFPAEILFPPQSAELRSPRIRFIDGLVTSLSSAPGGVLFKVEILVGTDYDSSKIGDTIEPLSRARAAALAVSLIQRGVPPAAFAIGAVGGKADTVKMTFSVTETEQKGGGGTTRGRGDAPAATQGTVPVGGGKAK